VTSQAQISVFLDFVNFTEIEKYVKIREFYCLLNVEILNSQSMLSGDRRTVAFPKSELFASSSFKRYEISHRLRIRHHLQYVYFLL